LRLDLRRAVPSGDHIVRDPAITFLLVLIIGIAAGLLFDRFAGPGWLSRQFTGNRNIVTSALVGVAGAFIGFHLFVLVGLLGILALIGAAVGAVVVLWLWRMV
jgi:uncharacterized membrane protein YeaQ/YmgE (transglycosylase-associated protein family)